MWQERQYSSPNFGSYVTRAPATWWLIGITVGAHVLRVLLDRMDPEVGHAILTYGAATPDGWRSFELWRSFTYMLLHAGASHLLWNMLFLGVAGSMLEPTIGSRAFLRIYIISGLIGSISPIFHGNPLGTVGASGAINGALVALAVFMPDVIILFMFLIPMKIKWVVAIFLGIDMLNLISRDSNPSDSICHLLGAATGFTIAFVGPRYVSPWLSRRRVERAREQQRARIEQELDEERELDRLLEKISREGITALTESERKFLKRASAKYQNARKD
jgi:membrane associated rhomboid family serine protease